MIFNGRRRHRILFNILMEIPQNEFVVDWTVYCVLPRVEMNLIYFCG